jgi:hypothetical protein
MGITARRVSYKTLTLLYVGNLSTGNSQSLARRGIFNTEDPRDVWGEIG